MNDDQLETFGAACIGIGLALLIAWAILRWWAA
jgi:hypothetical protein